MSKSSTTTANNNQPPKSAWARGPPQSTPTSGSPVLSRSQSPSNANAPHLTHSRKPSGLGPGTTSGVAIKDGVSVPRGIATGAARPASVINFGSIDQPSAPLSSSPAAAPTMSSEAGNIKTFGTISANGTGNSTPSTPAASTSGSPAPPTQKKKVDIHKLFQGGGTPAPAGPPQPTRTNSGHADTASPSVRPSPLPQQQQPGHYQQNSQSNIRSQNGSGGPRSPQISRPLLNGAGRPPGPGSGPPPAALSSPRMQQQPVVAPQGQPQVVAPQQSQHQPPSHQPPPPPTPQPQMQPMSQWPPYYYPPGYYPPEMYLQQPGYWHHAHPQHPQGQQMPPMSPRPGAPPLTPVQPPQTPTSSTVPVPNPSRTFNSSAPAFVPRRSAVVIKTADGREVNFHAQKTESPEPASAKAVPPREVRRQSAQIRIEDPEKKRQEEEKKAKAKKEEEERAAKAKREAEEKERLKKEEEERRKKEEEEKERLRKEEEEKERIRKEEEEKERIRKEEEEKERIRKEEEEKARLAKEEEERKERERLEQERLEQERLEQERLEADRLKKEEEERARKEEEERRIQKEEEARIRKEEEEKQKEKEREEKEKERLRQEDAAAAATPATAVPPKVSEAKKRPIPGRLDLTSASKSGVPQPPLSALASARIIEDLDTVTYPDGIMSPKLDLNVGAKDGKFRYDRDFLLQFMSICKEKPDSLPPLDAIGLEPGEQTPGYGRGGAGRRATSGSMAPPNGPPRASGLGLGIIPGGFGGKPGGGSGFSGMGNFQPPSRMSSDERFAASNVGRSASVSVPFPRAIPMSRSSSQGGPGTPASPRDGSQGSNRTRSQRGGKRNDSNKLGPAPSSISQAALGSSNLSGPALEPVAPLEQSANRWTATSTSRRGQAVDVASPEIVERKVKALLNKLTMERFDSISDQIIEFANRSEKEQDGRTLIQVIKLVFEKATDEATWSEMYARLCRKMMEKISPDVRDDGIRDSQGNHITGGHLFRKYLLNRCQEDFERGWTAKEDAQARAAGKASEDAAAAATAEKGETVLYSDEYYAAAKAKRRGLGLVKFIGELFKLSMLTERIMHECIKKLLSNTDNPEEEEIESLCQLLSTVGQALDTPKAKGHMDIYFNRMQETAESPHITPRMKFMLLDVIDLRARGWVARNKAAAPTTIAQVHEAAAKEKAAQEKEAASRTGGHNQMVRGGSRRGEHRSSDMQQGGDGWNVAGGNAPRPPAKAGDLSHFGKINKSTAMTFGPSSVFTAGKKDGKSGRDTPTLSRTNSSSNMFSMLSQANADTPGPEPTSGPAGTRNSSRPPSRKTSIDLTQPGVPDAAGSGRRRLQLLPRTKPVNVEKPDDGKVEAEEEGSSEEESGPAMDEKQAKAKIEEDIKELFSVRDLSEGVEYFESLPTEHRHLLVDGLVSKALDMKDSDVILVCNLFTKVADKGSLSAEAWDRGFSTTIEFLDDIAVDVPTAFTVMARLLKAAKLPESAVGALGEKIAVDGAPVVSPRERLLKEFAKLA